MLLGEAPISRRSQAMSTGQPVAWGLNASRVADSCEEAEEGFLSFLDFYSVPSPIAPSSVSNLDIDFFHRPEWLPLKTISALTDQMANS